MSRSEIGKKLKKLPEVAAWDQALAEFFTFGVKNNGTIKLIPKKGTDAYKKIKKRQREILAGK